MSVVRIATRRSDLALWQARYVAAKIESALGVTTEIVPLETAGDRLQGSLAKVGGKGLFVAEIENALLDGRADVAVHSAKDLPAKVHPDLCLAAFPERADPRDALVTRRPGDTLSTLRKGARVGTGSVRRAAQLRRLRPDLEIAPLRGNVPTRLQKLSDEGLDAVALACAGLDRLGLGARIGERVDPVALLPSVAQGALAVQAHGEGALAGDLSALNDPDTERRVAAERAFLCELGGDCSTPIAALATKEGGVLRLRGLVISPDGLSSANAEAEVPAGEAERAGVAVAREVLAAGGRAILAAIASAPA